MGRKGINLVFLCVACCATPARAVDWQVRPQVCIAPSADSECKLSVSITTDDLPQGQYCLYLDRTLITCFSEQQHQHEITLRLTQNAQLSLVDQAGQAILQQLLSIKGRQPAEKRRRIRQPWSLF